MSPKDHLRNWDIFFDAQAAPCAVRNRKGYFLGLLRALRATNLPKTVLNIASGSAREVVEFLSETESLVSFECVDCDEHAIAYSLKKTERVSDQVKFHLANAFWFSSANSFDLVWSAGLFDYLDDRAFQVLLKRLCRFVKPGGELVVGNFSVHNPTRDCMEFGNWFLNHRSVEELVKLAEDCNIPRERIAVDSEPLGVNLFLHIHL